jgi:hypothetical protein
MFILPGVDEVSRDVLPARTNTLINVRARPRRRTTYKTNINYQVITLQGNILKVQLKRPSAEVPTCTTSKLINSVNYQMNVVRVFLDEVEKTESVLETSTLCSVTVQGVYPTLTVQDLRATGSGETYSKLQLWNLFSLERLLSVRFIFTYVHTTAKLISSLFFKRL